ncbi:MAG: hypothetical protein OXJ52_06595, partial [Oligoflexia bacterium]|nr:hypothetical protein [Oligoflexia bacterium]
NRTLKSIDKKALKRVVEWIGIISYWISFGLYIVIISILGFFAGYILFFGTMFRAYGMLKVFFILLLTVSLWPLLWHSINFAVWTIAVSDNALANNVIIGGASLAKVFIPIWLISKTSKFPVSQALKKISRTGGSMALAGGSYAYSSFRSNTENVSQNVQNKEEFNNEGAEINFTKLATETETSPALPFQNDEDYFNDSMSDFSISERQPETQSFENTNQNEFPIAENNQQNIKQEISTKQTINQENDIKQESQNDINKDFSIENNPQVTKEIKGSQNISQNQNYNESILNESESQNKGILEEAQNQMNSEVSNTERKSELFNEAIHKEDWIKENEQSPVSDFERETNNKEEAEL